MDNHDFDELIVVKRSGQRVNFNGLKIAIAIKKAFDNVSGPYTEKDVNRIYEETLYYISNTYKGRKTINVEDIQDIIEQILNGSRYPDVYQEFSGYRLRRAESRKAFAIKQQHKFVKAIEAIGYLNSSNDKPNETLFKFGKTISLEYTKSYVIDNKYVRNHEEGKIYLHHFSFFNLGYLGSTHLKINKTLENDECFSEVLTLLINAKREIHSEIAIDDLDEILSKYILVKFKQILKNYFVKYVKVTGYYEFINNKKFEEILYRESTININLDNYSEILLSDKSRDVLVMAINDTINDIKNILNNNIHQLLIVLNSNHEDNKYYSFSLGSSISNEGILVQRITLDVIKKLIPLNNISLIYKVNNNISEELINELSTLISNHKNIKLLFEGHHHFEYFASGLKINEGTGKSNIANISINMARLGLKYQRDSKEFYSELDELLEVTKNELLFVFETIGDKKKYNYDIIFNNNILDDDKLESNQSIRKVIKAGTLNINLIGLKECSYVIDSEHYFVTVLKIINYIKNKVNNYSLDTKLNFTLSGINYQDVSQYLIDIDKTIFGLIDKVTKKNRYENICLVNNLDNIKEISEISKLLTGGNILELNLSKNTSVKRIAEYIKVMNDSDIEFCHIGVGSSET